MCDLIISPTAAVAISTVGCWSIAFWSALSHCASATTCRVHRRCRRCLLAAGANAAPRGFAGLAVSLIGVDMWPTHCLAVAGVALVLGGLAGLTQADWRRLTIAFLDAFRRSIEPRIKEASSDDGDDDAK